VLLSGDFTGSLAQIEDGLRKLNINEEVSRQLQHTKVRAFTHKLYL
jgi:hypothetical protein